MRSLSSLTHSTPPTHTSPILPIVAVGTVEDGEGGTADDGVRRDDVAGEFNLTEFLTLANRVVDAGTWTHDEREAPLALLETSLPAAPYSHDHVATSDPSFTQVPAETMAVPLLATMAPPMIDIPPTASAQGGMSPTAAVDPPAIMKTDKRTTAPPLAAVPPSPEHSMGPSPAIFIGNVPLNTSTPSFDKIAADFHNSTQKILSYVSPTVQNGEIVVRPSLEMIRNGSRRWSSTAVGYFLGKKPYFHHVRDFARSVWPIVRDVTTTSNGFFFFQFSTTATMEEVIEGGPWLFHGQPIILQKWEPGMVLRKLQHTQVPVWIKLRHLPVELWTTEGLSIVASGIGKPLYPDGGESACKVDVEYEWLPPKCNACVSLGHSTKECPMTKPKQAPVSVYVQKPAPRTREHREPRTDEVKRREAVVEAPTPQPPPPT
ncbi:UNVERIFIED_CONTAM: hypothetical protein Sradi_7131000 [Sesamum radiatum]|uniref:DUF4283 domain-containing protein n=1 Tax=Sesamum radiatum TaxID=300843 RepID=A0AAW2IY83_SESRA